MKNEESKEKEKIESALMKVALGYQLAEVTEEYAEVDGELKLTKRKKTKKDVPPDLKAVQMLLSGKEDEYFLLSDEELEREKQRLLEVLKSQEKIGKAGGMVEMKCKSAPRKRGKTVKKTAKKP